MAEHCPSCGAPLSEADSKCQQCGGATTRRYAVFSGGGPKSATPAAEITLPCAVPDARYPVADVWTHGQLYLTDLGIYFLAEADGPWTAEKLLTIVPPDPSSPSKVGPSSYFLPLNRIERFQHSRLTSYSVVTPQGKKALRLSPEGWKMIDAFAAKSGIPTA
ncbi:MAG TPA: hypothetical protein VFS19_00575 [Planctomycetota bacterium]|nr:hypothetical protein [Planctomycetota bacterium]